MKRKIIILINGVNTSGKDTFIGFFSEICFQREVYNITTIKPAMYVYNKISKFAEKDNYYLKDDAYRQALQEINTVLWRINEVPLKYIDKKIKSISGNSVIFVHCREPHNIKRIQEFYLKKNFRVITLLIHNNNVIIANNPSDQSVYNMKYDVTINNNSNQKTLKAHAFTFYKKVILKL